jgi:hypothetical protein
MRFPELARGRTLRPEQSCLNQEAVGTKLSSVIPKRSTSDGVRARLFFETLDRANRYAILYRVQTARKPDTRARPHRAKNQGRRTKDPVT